VTRSPPDDDADQQSFGEPRVAQASSPAVSATPPRTAYRRYLPHLQRTHKPVFITFATWKRRALPERVRQLVLDCVVAGHGVRFSLHAAVIMPDHVHVLLTPTSDEHGETYGIAQIMHTIKGASAHAVNKALGHGGRVWQPESFDHVLRSDESTRQKADYIRANPVPAALVQSEDDYAYLWREWVEGQ
jgi:REP element-mobilizing transposase RayT